MKKGQETTTEIVTATQEEQAAIAPDVIYKNNIYALVDDVKQLEQFKGLTDEELKNNKSFFPVLVDYIYNNYIGDILGNKYGKQVIYKDIMLLDNLFNIYTGLVYKYKWNNRPLIVEFSLFTGISRESIYNWVNGLNNDLGGDNTSDYITRDRVDTVRKWISTCERALIDGNDTIKDIFILKAKHGYRDNNNDIQITVNHKNILSADDLPALIDLENSQKP